jgi:hypothetical protein
MTRTLDASCECALLEVTREYETFWKFKIQLTVGSNESIKSPREQIVTVDIMMTSCCLRAPKKHEAWLAWMSLQATTSSIRFVLLVAIIFAGSPLATKSHLHDSYFTLNTHPCISKNAEQARTGRGFLAKWVLCIVGVNLRRNVCPSRQCVASCKRTSCELLRYTEIQWHSCSACCKLLIHGIRVDYLSK